MNKETFINKAKQVHGEKYDYTKVVYVNNRSKVCIICPKHGEFWQTPDKHLQGQGCPTCGGTLNLGKSKFIEKANIVHGGKYDYNKIEYVNNKTKVCIICPEHGEFWQTPHNHLKGQGCPICGKELQSHPKYTAEEFFEKALNTHEGKYDYSLSEYQNLITKIKIVCPEHGEFWQLPYLHIRGSNCPYCSRISNGLNKKLTNEEFIKKARSVHGDRYDYSKVEYQSSKEKVCITCSKHGEFFQTPDKHLSGCGCPKCASETSLAECEIFNFCKKFYNDTEQSNRSLIHPYELDIFIPSLKIAIEYNGLFWHSESIVRDNNYHLKKLQACKEKGIKLIQIFEDEYINHKEIVLEKLKHLLHVQIPSDYPRIMGRKCIVEKITAREAKTFLLKNHIQGYTNSTIHLGAFYNDKLIGVMSFRKEEKDGNKWELTRFATHNDYICQGVGGKLFKFFIKNYNPQEVKSFADRRWTIDETNNLYINLGFKLDSYVKPDYHYIHPGREVKREHKFKFRKQILHRKYGFPLSMTENQMTKKLGYRKVYDCGLIRYIWKLDDNNV